jgi:flagellar hook protein FlgE
MIQSLYSGISGLEVHKRKLDVIGNDVANVNTVGYKQSEVTFKEALIDTLRVPAVKTPGIQVGYGANLGAITRDFSGGMLTDTGVDSNLALQGPGFFMVQDTDASFSAIGSQYYTRAGDFVLDVKDADTVHLITPDGKAVIATDGDPVNLEPAGAATLSSFAINSEGEITIIDSDGNSIAGDTIRIITFRNNNGLQAQGSNLYTWTEGASPTEPVAAAANNNDVGNVQQGFLESSNTDLAKEFVDMITAQRGFQANSKTITTSDEILQDLLTLKR